MREEVFQKFEDFLNDFRYDKLLGYDAFEQPFALGSKLIVINISPYQDGLMLEVQLAIKVKQVEDLLFSFYQKYSSQLSLTYWTNLSNLTKDNSKRYFIQNSVELSKSLVEIETALVRKGFTWLDEISDIKSLSKLLEKLIFVGYSKPSNLFKLCQRSYLMRLILKEYLTESVFYEYYEQLQTHKVPQYQLEEFMDLRNYLADIKF